MAQDLGLGGAGMLGAAFGGAPRLRRAAYQQEQSLLARAFAEAASARKDNSVADLNSARLAAQQTLSAKFQAAGMAPAKADLAATAVVAASTSNPNEVIGAGQQLQAQDAGLAGDTQAMNVINSARTGKPLAMTSIEGNTAFNPNVAPDAQALAPTQVGQSIIGKNDASAGADSALTNQRNVLTPLLAALDRARTGAADRSNNPKTKGPSASDLRLVFSAPDTDRKSLSYGLPVVDKQALGDFFASGETLPQYVQEHFGSNPAPAASAAAPAAGLPSNVRINMAPGTDPRITAAVQAAAAAESRLPKNTPAAGGGGPIAKPTTQADFDALPKGTLFVNPKDGRTYRKK